MSMYDNKHHVFAVWGAPGGGKTTLACNMAVVLADSGFMTCLVSATDHGELQSFFGTAIPKGKGMYAAVSSGRNVREALTEARPNLCLLELDTGGDAYDLASITPEQVKNIIADLRDQFTYIIIDCTSYKESVFTGIGLVESDKVIVCIPHRVSAATWHIANEQMLEALAVKTFYVDVDTREGGCNIEQLMSSIDLPECDVKMPCVDSAYYCENHSQPIVLRGGKNEKKYKNQILKLIKIILDIEEDENKRMKRNKRMKGKTATEEEREKMDQKHGLFGKRPKQEREEEPRVRKKDGLSQKKMSKKQRAAAEEEAIRRAQESRRRAQMEVDDDDDDEDDGFYGGYDQRRAPAGYGQQPQRPPMDYGQRGPAPGGYGQQQMPPQGYDPRRQPQPGYGEQHPQAPQAPGPRGYEDPRF